MSRTFPWSAVIGQEHLKRALLLCAIDPAIGGVLIRGPRGVAKTTLARAFAELLPGRFVELPLGATEERVTGTLDLGQALSQGAVHFSPGLLARAHDGVLYVDEVNLLPDALVDLLLDAAASGRNVVERDGVSHSHDARFVLLGTMNPEEGELRPQLADRFGLCADAAGELSPAERTEIALRRLDYERDPDRFVQAFEAEQGALVARCRRARDLAQRTSFAGAGVARVAELCHAAGVDGVRADLAMLRAARAHAAWHARSEILVADVDAVAELSLCHRRRASSTPPKPAPPAGGPPASGRATPGATSRGRGSTPSVGTDPSAMGDRDSGVDAIPVRATEAGELPRWLFEASSRAARRPTVEHSPTGKLRRGRQALRPGAIDWHALLSRRSPRGTALLRRRMRRVGKAPVWVVAIDCSASMLRSGALGLAKGVAVAIARAAAPSRARSRYVAFGGNGAHGVRVESPSALEQAIVELRGGGGTPLGRALSLAISLCEAPARNGDAGAPRLFVLTDGRSRDGAGELAPRARGIETVIIDCERGPLRLGRSRALASAMGASYVHLESLAGTAGQQLRP